MLNFIFESTALELKAKLTLKASVINSSLCESKFPKGDKSFEVSIKDLSLNSWKKARGAILSLIKKIFTLVLLVKRDLFLSLQREAAYTPQRTAIMCMSRLSQGWI